MNLNIGDKIKLDIRKQGINGEGIGYYYRTLVFVPGAINKEKVYCEIEKVDKNYATGKIIKFLRESKKRVTPPCKFYDDCGGCQLQHVEEKEQLKIKRKLIMQALRKYTALDVDTLDIKKTISMKEPYHYRNKSQMPFRNTKFGLALGFYKADSNHFVYVDECLVHHREVNKINQKVLTLLRSKDMKAYDFNHKDGNFIYLVTRYLEDSNQASVTFVVRKFDESLNDIAKETMKRINSVKSVTYTINDPKSNLVISDKVHLLAGKMWIDDRFNDINVKISPDAFHQLNTIQMKKMYQKILELIDPYAKETVLDLYSGIGITSMLLAKKAKKVYAIDFSHASIKDAVENARINGIKHIDFIADRVETAVPKLIQKGVKPDLILMDPPRKGLSNEVLKSILKALPKVLVYVSCNPSTLAKDLDALLSTYTIKQMMPIDMFPNTASVESITLLELK